MLLLGKSLLNLKRSMILPIYDKTLEMTADSIEFVKIKRKWQSLVEKRDGLISDIARLDDIKKEQQKLNQTAKRSILFLQKLLKRMQEDIADGMSSIVTAGERTVFSDPNSIIMSFEERRNQIECDIWFVKDGKKMSPFFSSGGGPVDVASVSFRMLFVRLENKRPIVFLDEPFKFVSKDVVGKCAEMIEAISDELGIQIIMTTHIPELINCADKLFEVKIEKGVSVVTTEEFGEQK